MLLVNKKRIIYNGSEYFINIKKTIRIIDIPFAWIFGLDKYYKIKFYIRKDMELYDFTLYKLILKLKVEERQFNKDIDKVINYALNKLGEQCKETKYINNIDDLYMIDNKWQENLYKQFYNKVITDLKEKGLIDKELFNNEKSNILDRPIPPPVKRVWR